VSRGNVAGLFVGMGRGDSWLIFLTHPTFQWNRGTVVEVWWDKDHD